MVDLKARLMRLVNIDTRTISVVSISVENKDAVKSILKEYKALGFKKFDLRKNIFALAQMVRKILGLMDV